MSSDKPTRAQIQAPSTHYGNGKAATRHFITQRLTGAFNILFALFMVWFVVSLAGKAPAEMIELARNPFVAIGLVLLVVNVSVHMRNGMRDTIEDYFDKGAHSWAMVANNLFTGFFFVVALGAIAKLVFWG
ncbi:succinate dehydrogenase, hydrophobic membrane anchor protein [Devosia sp. ZB163]|uniref:succinate dehydrogenase, hydrophobic membrane anchor protein n=1 Tax=Devosia sp. ZB163 TaxID=3025938 RepID=UPI002362DCA8|nr:succinate dehydrogenase, hydrophobic membrane anchor protein [Devosia sp. ZB163]MDC9822152.1 succinate dehydrogenase, hydrophobic membrane anchor protein [Devosia sp. ZB163]